MGNMIEVGKDGEMAEGSMKEVQAQGREILIARVGGKYYAADNRCPHMRGRLSRGKLEGTVVTCPRHGSRFDLENGKVVRWLMGSGLLSMIGRILKSPRPLATYPVTVRDGGLFIEVK